MLDPIRKPAHMKLLLALDLLERARTFVLRRDQSWRQADKNRGAFYEHVWREAANAVGAEIEACGRGVFEIRRGSRSTRVHDNSTAMDHLATHVIVRTKPVIYRLLAAEGLPIPRHLEFEMGELAKAAAFMEKLAASTGCACVVKPASDTGGGLGVTTGIRQRWPLARAAWAAAKSGGGIMIEEQVKGDNYRLLYLDGHLLDAVQRRPPTITGDGHSSIAKLVAAANAARLQQGALESHGLLTADLDMQRTLEGQGLTMASVPGAGVVVTLKTVINENRGIDNETVTHLVCDDLIAEGARAARVAGVRLAGVDVITTDPGVALSASGGVILEVNSPPGYYWHYHKRDGSFALGVHVLEDLLREDTKEKTDVERENHQ